jgi:hypothetical protein
VKPLHVRTHALHVLAAAHNQCGGGGGDGGVSGANQGSSLRFFRSVSKLKVSDVALNAVVIHETRIETIGTQAHFPTSSSATIAMIDAGTLSHTVSTTLQMFLSVCVSIGAPSTSRPPISRRRSITGLKNDITISTSFAILPALRC